MAEAKATKVSVRQAWIRAKNAALDLKNGYAVDKNYVVPQSKAASLEKVYFIQTEQERTPEPEERNDIGTCTRIVLYSSLILLPIAFTLTLASLATPFWLDNGNTSIGLFQSCSGSATCSDAMSSLPSSAVTDTWILVICVHVIGTFCLMLAVIFLMCIYIHCAIGTRKSIIFGVFIAITALIGGISVITGILIVSHYYVAQSGYLLSWSFYFAAAGGGAALVVFCLLLIHICMVTCKCD